MTNKYTNTDSYNIINMRIDLKVIKILWEMQKNMFYLCQFAKGSLVQA